MFGRLVRPVTYIPRLNVFSPTAKRGFTTHAGDDSIPFVVSALGTDRVGIMSQLSGTVTKNGGNIESGRMTKLGREFCVMMLVTVPGKESDKLSSALKSIEGITVSLTKTQPTAVPRPAAAGTRQRVVKLAGTDQPGILHAITAYFAKNNINVDDMITYPEAAPFSSTPLFHMEAVVSVPSQYNTSKFESDIKEVGDKVGVDVWVESFKPKSMTRD